MKKSCKAVWFWSFESNDDNNLVEIVIKNDSITLVDYFNFVKKGIYSLKNDSIFITLKDEILSKKITITDTSLSLNASVFEQEPNYITSNYSEINLINVKSEIIISAKN